MIKRFILLFLVFVHFNSKAILPDSLMNKSFSPDIQHGFVLQALGQSLNMYHYTKPRIDDALSSRFLDNYIRHLDPSKVYFTQIDSNNFNSYKTTLDDDIINGNAQTGFNIYNIYQRKVYERTLFALDLLNTHLNYNTNDSFLIDRENAAFASSEKALDNIWRQKITYEVLVLKIDGKADTTCINIVKKRYENLLKQFYKLKTEDVFSIYANALSEIADQHSNYFSPRMAEDFNTSMSLSLEGIGATLQTENEYTKVREIVKGGPADKSQHIFANDKIVGVGQGKDGEIISILDWRIDDVVSKIRGKKGTIVRLEIIPHDAINNKTKIIEITRDKIVLEDQASKSQIKEYTINGQKRKFGLITVPAFYMDFAAAERGDKDYKSTTRDVRKLINELKKENINGLIIDLRNNGGGSLKEAIELSGLFIPNGPVVQVKDVQDNISVEDDKDPNVLWDGPLTILVNSLSASASEIFSAAMQDYGRAMIVGEQTYGKGTVQNMIDFNNFQVSFANKKLGSLKITMAKFYRISGASTQHRGVIPDFIFPALYNREDFGEDASPFSLPYDSISSANYKGNLSFANKLSELQKLHVKRMEQNTAFKRLNDEIQQQFQLRHRKFVSLNFNTLKSENEIIEASKKIKEEALKAEKEKSDLILDSGAAILADYIDLQH